MKFLIVIALVLASTTAFDLRPKEIHARQRFMPANRHEGRIVGGENADIINFNYQVGLSLKKGPFSSFWCGGSLIASEWILTAAHCIEDVYKLTVYLGDTERARAEVEFDIVRNSDNVIVHEGFIRETMLNDIALIRIPAVKYSDKIRPIRLNKISCNDGTFPGDFAKASDSLRLKVSASDIPSRVPRSSCNDGTFPGDFATASGWGLLGDNPFDVPSTLQSVTLRIISNDECARSYGKAVITNGNICLSTKDGIVLRSTCDGDSGGPLVLKGTNLQIGLTSFGAKKGCELGYPVAFTRISSFIDWIVAKTGITV